MLLRIGLALATALAAGCRQESPEVSLQTGMTRLMEGDFRGAVRRLERAARLLPENATAHGNLGIAYWKLGQDGRAESAFRRAADLNRSDPRPLEFLGQTLMRMKRWDEARAAFDAAYQRSAPNARILTEMALLQIRTGKANEGQALLKQALLLDPSYPPALYDMAVFSKDTLRNNDEATKNFQRYLTLAGDDPHADTARRFLGLPTLEREQPASSRSVGSPTYSGPTGLAGPGKPGMGADTNAAIRLETKPRLPAVPSPADPLLAVARSAIQKQSYDEALVMLNQAMKKDPANANALWELAELYDKHLGYQDSAAQVRRKFRQMFPDDPRAGDKLPVEPAASLVKAPSVPPDPEAAREAFQEGLKLQKAQEWEQAIHAYKHALEHDRNFADAAYNLGLAYKDNGESALSRDAFLYALKIKPDLTRAAYMLAIVYMETKDNEKAIVQLEKVLKLEPDNAKAHYLLGLAYRTELHFDEAKKHFERYIQLEPNEPPAREAREWLDSLNKRPAGSR